jgi:hypothetical protein
MKSLVLSAGVLLLGSVAATIVEEIRKYTDSNASAPVAVSSHCSFPKQH